MAVVHDQLRDVHAGQIRHVAWSATERVRQRGRATGRLRGERPPEGQRVAVGVRRAHAIELHEGSWHDSLIRTGVGHWRRVTGRDDDRVWRAVHVPVVDDELRHIRARRVHGERRAHVAGVHDRSVAAGRRGAERPEVGQRVSIDVLRGAAIEDHLGADTDRLIGSGIGDRG